MPPVISLRGVDHHYGQGALRRQVLFEVDLDIQAGEIVLLTGPSGSGKTTLLTLLGALRSPQRGSVKVLGQEMFGARSQAIHRVRSQVGYIFQSHNLLSFITVRQNVRMALELHAHHLNSSLNRVADDMLRHVGLEDHLDKYPEQLSGGQRQRVAIARALVSRPPLVLADEPTAALDRQSGRDIVDLMQNLAHDQGCTILMVTHDNRILDVADRILTMEDGRLAPEP